jgi:hypothetical protein
LTYRHPAEMKVSLGTRRHAVGVVDIAVKLILFATLGVVALGLLFTATTTSWPSGTGVIAITVVGILAAIGVALSMLPKGHKGL